jgi:hypothetical protein
MNRPKATRLRLCLAIVAAMAFAVVLPSAASADFAGGTGLSVTFANPTPGAHSDMTVTHTYTYNGVPTGGAASTGDDLKQWVLESPIGFYGNPSAVPWADRCTQDQMNAYVKSQPMPGYLGYPGSRCPASSQVGTASLTLGVDANGATGAVLPGKIYVVQSANPLQELPTTLFIVFETTVPNCASAPVVNCITAALSKTQVAPVTGGSNANYRLRSASEFIDRPDLSATLGQPNNTTLGHIKGIQQTLWGKLPQQGDAPFLTNPTTCNDWDSSLFSRTYGNAGMVGSEAAVSNATQTETLEGTASPGGGDTGFNYARFDSPATAAANCEQSPALTQTASGGIDNNARGANPGLTVNVSNPDSNNVDKANKFVTTLPSTVTINVAALNNVCQNADLLADTCPAASQVGTAEIVSPILSATQHGRVYMTNGATQGLPYLSIWVNGPNESPAGAFKFRIDVTTQFVGPNNNKIETTFANLPQLPFDSFNVKINGGSSTNSLLLNRDCPTEGETPDDGPISFVTSGYAGGSAASSSPTNLDPCYGVANPKSVSRCVKVGNRLSVRPSELIAISTISYVQLLTGSSSKKMKRLATDKTATFSFKSKLSKSKFKKKRKYYYGFKVVYKDGKSLTTKAARFKTCK